MASTEVRASHQVAARGQDLSTALNELHDATRAWVEASRRKEAAEQAVGKLRAELNDAISGACDEANELAKSVSRGD